MLKTMHAPEITHVQAHGQAQGELRPLVAQHAAFEAAIAPLRPALYRYCTRMTGSLFDGEDVVQDILTKAYAHWPENPLQLRAWLFRLAHHRSVDYLRQAARRDRRFASLSTLAQLEPNETDDAAQALEAADSARLGLTAFVRLTPLQRSCVLLKDVLGFATGEIAALLDTTPGAVKAALLRGRRALRRQPPAMPPLEQDEQQRLAKYVAAFNARDFDSLRDQLQAEVRLDLVACLRLDGAAEVGQYFTRYAALADLQALPLAGTAALTIEDREGTYPVLLAWAGGEITRICDYRYAREQGRALLAGL